MKRILLISNNISTNIRDMTKQEFEKVKKDSYIDGYIAGVITVLVIVGIALFLFM